jgi:hypothetical protein
VSAPLSRRTAARRRRRFRGLGLLVGLAVVFAVGIALGESLHDNPSPGGTQTLVRTLLPLQLAPAARTTVTVTSP